MRLSLFSLLLILLFAPPARSEDPAWTPILDLRVREEILDEVYAFAPDPDRNWIRVRSRIGGRVDFGDHRLELRIGNEHRHHFTPERRFDGDEIFVDNLFWSWKRGAFGRITVGRQDIVWPGGFLMLEGHPLDGSRSIYHDALRWQSTLERGTIDLALIRDTKVDDWILADDKHRRLSDTDESGLALRATRGDWALSFLFKADDDPDGVLADLRTWTSSLRRDGTLHHEGRWHAELASQYQDGEVVALDRRATGGGWAFAFEGSAGHPVGAGWSGEAGAFWYSGLDGNLRPFRTPWGRWPKWSELYIYARIGESSPGRVTVAAWDDVAAPWVTLRRALHDRIDLRLTTLYLLAPSRGDARGFMTQARLDAGLGGGIKAHLLWEMLDPGSYHDGRYGLAPMTEIAHFLRWEVSWSY